MYLTVGQAIQPASGRIAHPTKPARLRPQPATDSTPATRTQLLAPPVATRGSLPPPLLPASLPAFESQPMPRREEITAPARPPEARRFAACLPPAAAVACSRRGAPDAG